MDPPPPPPICVPPPCVPPTVPPHVTPAAAAASAAVPLPRSGSSVGAGGGRHVAVVALGSRGDVQPLGGLAVAVARKLHARVTLITHGAHVGWLASLLTDVDDVVVVSLAEPVVVVSRGAGDHTRQLSSLQVELLAALQRWHHDCAGGIVVANLFALDAIVVAGVWGLPAIAASPYIVPVPGCATLADAAAAWQAPLHDRARWACLQHAAQLCTPQYSSAPPVAPPPLPPPCRLLYGWDATVLAPMPAADLPASAVATGYWWLPADAAAERCTPCRVLPRPIVVSFGAMVPLLAAAGEAPLPVVGADGFLLPPPASCRLPDVMGALLAAVAATGAPVVFICPDAVCAGPAGPLPPLPPAVGALADWPPYAAAFGTCASSSDWRRRVLVVRQQVPFHWLLPQASALVHHGGSGTTAAAAAAGIPTFVVPVAFDQFAWAAAARREGIACGAVPWEEIADACLERAVAVALAREEAAAVGGCGGAAGASVLAERPSDDDPLPPPLAALRDALAAVASAPMPPPACTRVAAALAARAGVGAERAAAAIGAAAGWTTDTPPAVAAADVPGGDTAVTLEVASWDAVDAVALFHDGVPCPHHDTPSSCWCGTLAHHVVDVTLPNGEVLTTTCVREAATLYREVVEARVYDLRAAVGRHARDLPPYGPLHVIDVGAHVGMFINWLALAHRGRPVRCIAVEPVAPSRALLRHNLAAWWCSAIPDAPAFAATADAPVGVHVWVVGAAAAACATTDGEPVAVQVHPHGLCHSTTKPVVMLPHKRALVAAGHAPLFDATYVDFVPPVSLAALIAGFGGDRVHLLKVDVEGAELDVLASASPADWALVDAVAMEVHDGAHGDRLAAALATLASDTCAAFPPACIAAVTPPACAGAPRCSMVYAWRPPPE